MIPEADKIAEDPVQRVKFIHNLEIPTFEDLSKVNFYDTLAMLCNQVVRAGHNKDRAIKNKNRLQAIKRFKLSYTKATGSITDGKGTENMLN